MKQYLPSCLFVLLTAFASPVFAATYTLPASIGSGPFSNCSGSGTVYNCSGDIDFNNNDVVILSSDITLNISGDLDFDNGFELVSGGNLLELNVSGDVDFGNNADFTGNITAGGDVDFGNGTGFAGNISASGDVDFGNNTDFVGEVDAGGDIDIGNNGDFTGDLTAGGDLDIGNNTTVDGICTPTHPACTGVSGPQIDHYVVSHSGQGVTCEAEPITVSAHDASHGVVVPSTGTTITLSTSVANDGWRLRTGNGSFNATTNEYTFDGVETFVVFELSRFTTVTGMDIDVSDGAASDLDGDPLEDENIDYVDSAFRFYADGVHNNIGIQIAGKSSSIAPGDQVLSLRAVRTSTDTGACETILLDNEDVEFTLQCVNPGSCARPLYLGATAPDTAVNAPTMVALDFGDDTQAFAEFVLNYPDAGSIRLMAQKTLVSGDMLTGTSNLFVARPFGFDINIVGNPAANSPTGPIFSTAGTVFTTNINAVLWNSTDDNDNDGIPDNHDDSDPSNNADLSSNTVTLGTVPYTGVPNFGQEGAEVRLASILNQPLGGNDPGLSGSTLISSFSAGAGTSASRFDEVGIIEISAEIEGGDYLGQAANQALSRSGYVGRFTPASFDVAVTNNGVLDDTCSVANPFTYIGQDFGYLIAPEIRVSALNALVPPAVTQNYRGSFVKLDTSSLTVSVSQDSSVTGSDGLPMLVNYSPAAMVMTANNNGTVDYTFGDDMFRYGNSLTTEEFIKLANSEVAPFDADIDPEISLVSDGEVSTVLSANVDLMGNHLRFGRIRMSNAHGSELLDLQIPMITEYFNGSFYQINSDDSCTQVDSSDINIITDNLSTPGSSTASVTNLTAGAGDIGITLSAPGAGVTGQIDLSSLLNGVIHDNKWLRYDWGNDGIFDNDPGATATFGIYKGNDVNIYIQQVFQ